MCLYSDSDCFDRLFKFGKNKLTVYKWLKLTEHGNLVSPTYKSYWKPGIKKSNLINISYHQERTCSVVAKSIHTFRNLKVAKSSTYAYRKYVLVKLEGLKSDITGVNEWQITFSKVTLSVN